MLSIREFKDLLVSHCVDYHNTLIECSKVLLCIDLVLSPQITVLSAMGEEAAVGIKAFTK